MLPFGPIYCETLAFATGFPAEPVNTWTNLVIIAFGLAALWLAHTHKPASKGPAAVAWLIIATGAGSLLWHGLRTPWALALDTLPGVVCLFVLMYYWLRRFVTRPRAWSVIAGSFIATAILTPLAALYSIGGAVFVPLAVIVTAIALWLIRRTRAVSRPASTLAAGMLAAAAYALAARTLDASGIICWYLPFGTHFLWHVLLSFAAFLGVLLLIRLDSEKLR